MKVTETEIPEVLVIEPAVFGDERGFFFEAYHRAKVAEIAGISAEFVQDNHSRSARGVLRGLHYQLPRPQGKLVRVVAGAVWDVAVDIRASSPTFTRWVGLELSATNKRQLWVPPGFAHGFVALEDGSEVLYKVTDYYDAEADRSIRWDDPAIGVTWPLEGIDPVLSAKDGAAPALADAVIFD